MKRLILLLLLSIAAIQSIQASSVVVYVYDEAGNRVARVVTTETTSTNQS